MKTRLVELLREHSVRWGEFTLKSGRVSDFYVDVRKTALHEEGSWVIAQAVLSALADDVQAVGGVELGAVPIVGSVVTLNHVWVRDGSDSLRGRAWDPDRHLHGFIVRKQPKAHGSESRIDNCPGLNDPVAIIEDVTTTGGSLWSAIAHAEDAGLNVVQAITVVDREEGAEEYLRAKGFVGEFTALVTRTDLEV